MPARTWPSSEARKSTIALPMPGGIENAAEQDEDRHRQEDDARHALVHASDHDEGRNLRGEGEIAQRADAEAEGDGHAGGEARGDEDDQEENDLGVPELHERGREGPEDGRDRGDHEGGDEQVAPGRGPQGIRDHDGEHGDHAEGNGRDAEGVGNVQRRRR